MSQHFDNFTKYFTSEFPEPFTDLILLYQNVTVL